MTSNAIVWFRQDLRLSDNPALHHAVEKKHNILPLYILDDENSGEWCMGAASRWWLHHSLSSLHQSLGNKLCLATGNPESIIKKLIQEHKIEAIYWNRCYEPWRIQRDTALKKTFSDDGIEVNSYNGSLLFEPLQTLKNDGTPYKVFTPFYKNGCLKRSTPRSVLTKPKRKKLIDHQILSVGELQLMPAIKWYEQMHDEWQPGEEGAQQRLSDFLDNGIENYKEGRDFPASELTSRLSPHLHFGEISPHQIWQELEALKDQASNDDNVENFRSELGWREFSNNLLYHFPEIPKKNLQEKFDRFSWRDDPEALKKWQQGMTGYPIVDAGMRELWQTGYMHNRVRMIVGSFLVKNLMIHWHHGEDWFWDTLLDADLANNSASWQWIAGCGADAAPYFRIFNPVTQGQKFDKAGEYVRRYIPEIKALPDQYIHNPWEAKSEVLEEAKISLGEDYPKPIVDLKESRERALAAFKQLSS